MNLYLHQVEPHITLGDSIYETPTSQRFDVILTNPPFGTKGANQAPDRDDFVVETSNKQLNFLQHVLTHPEAGWPRCRRRARQRALRRPGRRGLQGADGGLRRPHRAALPARHVQPLHRGHQDQRHLLHQRARRPSASGSTTPAPTSRRSPRRADRSPPSTSPSSRRATATTRTAAASAPKPIRPTVAGAASRIDEIKEHHYKLDAFKWLRDEELDDPDDLPEPEELITEAMEELQLALDDLADIQRLLEANGSLT